MRCVVLSADNRVVNVVELAERAEWSAPAGCALLASDVGDIGDSFDGTAFVPPVSGRTPALRRLVRRSVIVDRLQAAGNLPAARAALDAADLYTRERWSAREAIYADDPTAIALLQAIGRRSRSDPGAVILRRRSG